MWIFKHFSYSPKNEELSSSLWKDEKEQREHGKYLCTNT